MKTLLIVLAILVLLGMVVFILIHEHKKADEVSQPDSDAPEAPEKPEEEAEVEVAVPEDTSEPEPEAEPEVDIPEHCKPKEEPVDNLPNKYFFNIHNYISVRNHSMFCVVCSAVIKRNNYRVVVKNSYYPYMLSYTKKVINGIVSKYTDDMTLEEFLKTGSTNFNRVGDIVGYLPYTV